MGNKKKKERRKGKESREGGKRKGGKKEKGGKKTVLPGDLSVPYKYCPISLYLFAAEVFKSCLL